MISKQVKILGPAALQFLSDIFSDENAIGNFQ